MIFEFSRAMNLGTFSFSGCLFTCQLSKSFSSLKMNFESDFDYLSDYQKTLFTDINSEGIQRKCLAQMYNFSNSRLEQEQTCYIQETHKYYDSNLCDLTVKKKLEELGISGPVNLKTDIKNLSVQSLLLQQHRCEFTPLRRNEENDREEFLKAFQNKKVKEIKVRGNFTLQNRSKSEDNTGKFSGFSTGKEELLLQNSRKTGALFKRRVGLSSAVKSKFIPPFNNGTRSQNSSKEQKLEDMVEVDDRLKNIDPKMIELIKSEIMDIGSIVEWNDIAGLEFAKTAIQEAVVWPMLRPDIFKGLRRPPKGILLFGPPGTGKTLIGKCVASQSKSTFFSISASSLTSKWIGEGEKMVRALFAVARCHQPAVIFIDEIDSLLSQRSETEHESSRRIKTEFLVQLDGATTDGEERLLLIGATNRPQELDEAARRRFVKRLYIPLPEFSARLELVTRLMSTEKHQLSVDDVKEISKLSEGYSGADIRNLCSEASLGPIRSIHFSMIEKIQAEEVRSLEMQDFQKAFTRVKSSVSGKDLELYVEWDKTYGAGL